VFSDSKTNLIQPSHFH